MAQQFTGLVRKILLGLVLWPYLSSAMIMPLPPGDPSYPSAPPPQDRPTPPKGYPMLPDEYPMPPEGYPMPMVGHAMPPDIGLPLSGNMTRMTRSFHEQGTPPPGAEPDLSYCQMLLESPVPVSIENVPWFCVCSRCKGTVGPKGDRGDRGLPGIPGSPGRRGFTGFRGRPGFVGRQGLKGQKGDEGEKGERGSMGFTGGKGDRGYKGDKGDQGLEGPPGEQGPQGEPGQCPASCETIPGPAGDPGLPGQTGVRGLPGTAGAPGPKGEKGDTGSIGPPGHPGADGQKGDQGPQGACNCRDGINGTSGQPGAPGPKGDKGNMGLNGAPGAPGPKGQHGDQGEMGVPGLCSPTIKSAFSATLGSPYPPPNQPVHFTNVLYNVQGNFDPTIGMYTAPVNGTYVFSYNFAVFSKVLKVGLFHNFMPVVKTTEGMDMGTASQEVVLHLAMFDRVWIQVKDENTNGMYTSAESSSTFSGFLLYPDSCDPPLSRGFPPPLIGVYSWGNFNVPTAAP